MGGDMPLGKDGYMNILEKNMPLGQRDTWSFWRKICWEYASGENGPNILVPLLLEKSQSQTTSLQICGMSNSFETPGVCVYSSVVHCHYHYHYQYVTLSSISPGLVNPDNINSRMLTYNSDYDMKIIMKKKTIISRSQSAQWSLTTLIQICWPIEIFFYKMGNQN